MKRTIDALVVAALTAQLAGCTTNAVTGEYGLNRTTIGLAVGTTAGALAGAAMGDTSYIIKGVILGAAAGGGVGYYMEKKHREVQAKLENTGLAVEMAKDESGNDVLVISAPADVTFTVGSHALAADSYAGLTELAHCLKDQSVSVEIVGHTDISGTDAQNRKLSYERAHTVANYLHTNGVEESKLFVRGAGSDEPKASNGTPQGRANNRRVEILVRAAA